MRVMDEFSESTHRWTPAFPHAGGQSPRVGGCVGKFYQLFDWSLTKRFSSTKRITAGTCKSTTPSTITVMAINRVFVSCGTVAGEVGSSPSNNV